MRKRLRQGWDVETTIAEVIGVELAGQVVDGTRRATLRKVARGDGRRAVAPIGERALKDANAGDVRRVAQLLIQLCAWMRPRDVRGRAGKRTGHHGQEARLCMTVLERELGVERREIERYLALLRTLGVLRNWQPPASSKNDKGHLSGHCFQLYELAGDMPPELQQALATWHGDAGAAAPPAAAPACPPLPAFEGDAADAALAFVKGLVPY